MSRSPENVVRFLFFLLFIPGMTGIIRFYLGLDLSSSFFASILTLFACLVCEYLLRRKFNSQEILTNNETVPKYSGPIISIGLLFLIALVLHNRMANPSFFNLPIVGTEGGGDAGNHVMLSESFRLKNPKEYEGQNLFYVLISAIVDPATRDFHSAFWKSTFYLWFISLSSIIFIFFSVTKKFVDWRAILASGVFGVVILLAMSDRMILPYFHYLQIDGFFSSIAGVAVLLSVWSSFALLKSWISRCFVVFSGILILRHAYALNVGEYLAAASFVCFWESRNKEKLCSLFLKGCSIILLFFAIFVYYRLFPLVKISGGFTNWKPHNAYPLMLLFLLCSFLEVRLSSTLEDECENAYVRFLKFGGAFVSIGLAVQLFVFFTDLPLNYYFYKHAIPLFVFSSIGLIGILMRKLSLRCVGDVRLESLPLNRVAKFALVVGIFVAWTNSRIYYATYPIRRFDCTNGCHELSPLHFPFIQHEVQEVLEKKGKKFGGILHTHWPFFNFLTASLNRHVALWNEQPGFFSGSLSRSAGFCVFWSETQRERQRMIGFTKDPTYTDLKKARLAIYESLVASPFKECGAERGTGYWRNVLCWECR
jgi:hypothetical protein